MVQHLLGHSSITMTLDRYSHWIPSMGRHAADGMDEVSGWSTADVLLTRPPTRTSDAFRFYSFCRKKRGPTCGLKNRLPLLQLRVIIQALLGFARVCKSRIDKPVSFLYLAVCCTVLRSRWYQSGINIALISAF